MGMVRALADNARRHPPDTSALPLAAPPTTFDPDARPPSLPETALPATSSTTSWTSSNTSRRRGTVV
jgi:hypothetical protein